MANSRACPAILHFKTPIACTVLPLFYVVNQQQTALISAILATVSLLSSTLQPKINNIKKQALSLKINFCGNFSHTVNRVLD